MTDAKIAKLIPEPDEADDAEETTALRSGKLRTRKPKIEDPTGGMNPQELGAYQTKQRAHYASLGNDELESIASITTLAPPARQVLIEELAKRKFTLGS